MAWQTRGKRVFSRVSATCTKAQVAARISARLQAAVTITRNYRHAHVGTACDARWGDGGKHG